MAWTDAPNQHDPDAVASHFSADAVLTDVGTGQRAECVAEIRERKIVNASEYWNMADFLIQVGVLPPSGG
jgi:ketosteroid isomerase-like protein